MEYARWWRIQLAAERLRAGHESLAGIAASIGYDSQDAFTRAFKRVTSLTLGNWRERNQDPNLEVAGSHPARAHHPPRAPMPCVRRLARGL